MGRFRFGSVTGVAVVLILSAGMALFGLPALATHTDGWGSAILLGTDDAGVTGLPQVEMSEDGNAIAIWDQCEVGPTPSLGVVTQCTIWATHYSPGLGWGRQIPVVAGGNGSYQFPKLAMDPSGRAIVLWNHIYGPRFEFWDILASSFDPEVGWGVPTVVATVEAGIRDVAVDDSGHAIAVWEQCSKIRCNAMASRFSPTDGWGTATRIDTLFERGDSANAGFAQVAMDAVGNGVAVWEESVPDGSTRSSIWANRFDPGLGWGTPIAIDAEQTCCVSHPSVAINEEGIAIAVWTSRGTIWANRLVSQVGWGTATPVKRIAAGYSQVNVVTDAAGDAVAVWVEQNPGGFDGVFASRYIRGVGWTTPGQLGETRNSCGTECYAIQFAVDGSPNGDVIVAWDSVRNNAVFANRYDPHSGWGAPEWIGIGGLGGECPCPPDIDVDSAGNAFVVWRQFEWPKVNIWANRYVSPFQDSRTALAELDSKVLILLISQAALGVAAAVVLVLYWNARRAIRDVGRTATEGADPPRELRFNRGRLGRPRLKGEVTVNSSALGTTAPLWRNATVGGSLHVTAKERILLHLFDFAKYVDSVEVPPGLTPGGIAHAAGIDGRHFAQYIHPLVKEELVRGRSARVKGDVQRRKVYVLTEDGRRAAIGIRERLRPVVVRVRDASGQREATIGEVLAESRGSRSILDILGESVRDGVISRER